MTSQPYPFIDAVGLGPVRISSAACLTHSAETRTGSCRHCWCSGCEGFTDEGEQCLIRECTEWWSGRRGRGRALLSCHGQCICLYDGGTIAAASPSTSASRERNTVRPAPGWSQFVPVFNDQDLFSSRRSSFCSFSSRGFHPSSRACIPLAPPASRLPAPAPPASAIPSPIPIPIAVPEPTTSD